MGVVVGESSAGDIAEDHAGHNIGITFERLLTLSYPRIPHPHHLHYNPDTTNDPSSENITLLTPSGWRNDLP